MPHPRSDRESTDRARSIITVEHVNQLGASVLPPQTTGSNSPTLPNNGTREAVDQAFGILASRLVPILQAHLDTLTGRTDLDNQQSADLAKALTQLAKRLNLGFECPHCLESARALRYGKTGTKGSFGWRFEHTEYLKHGATTNPPRLKLVDRSSPEKYRAGT